MMSRVLQSPELYSKSQQLLRVAYSCGKIAEWLPHSQAQATRKLHVHWLNSLQILLRSHERISPAATWLEDDDVAGRPDPSPCSGLPFAWQPKVCMQHTAAMRVTRLPVSFLADSGWLREPSYSTCQNLQRAASIGCPLPGFQAFGLAAHMVRALWQS